MTDHIEEANAVFDSTLSAIRDAEAALVDEAEREEKLARAAGSGRQLDEDRFPALKSRRAGAR